MTRCQGGQKGWNQASDFSVSLSPGALATVVIRHRSHVHILHDPHMSGHLVIDHLAGHYEPRLIRRRRVNDCTPYRSKESSEDLA